MANSAVAVPVTVGVGMGVSKGVEKSGGSEDEKEMRKQVVKNVSFDTEPRPPSSRDSSTTGERMHRLHPAHARKTSESHALPNSDRHYPPPARSTYFSFSTPRPASRRNRSVDMSMPPVPPIPGQIYGHAPSSAASSVTSIGMAISTAPTSANSTPPPSTAGDITALDVPPFRLPTANMAPAVTHSRRSSLSEYLRTSTDTIRLPSNEYHERSQSQAPSTRGRRLSKSRPRQSAEAERPASVNRILAREVPLTKPSLTQTETMIHELNRLESQTLYGFDASSLLEQNPTKGKLTKGHTSKKINTENAKTGTATRWSFFSRRNSITGA